LLSNGLNPLVCDMIIECACLLFVVYEKMIESQTTGILCDGCTHSKHTHNHTPKIEGFGIARRLNTAACGVVP
jgi:hypothetical protein